MSDPAENQSGPRIIDLAEQPVYVSVKDRLLVLEPKDGEPARVELSEVAAVLAAHYAVTFTRSALAELANAGAIVVICDQRSMPVSMCLPIASFHAPARRLAAQVQAASKKPLGKRLWQSIVRAKVNAQAALLQRRNLKNHDLINLAAECKSGDPTNIEAQASRIYWQRLFGPEFRRITDPDLTPFDENRYLNYGYAVLRAIVCRSICGVGLHPGIGIHHHHRNNPFPLADDLMEPFRPLVDELALQLREKIGRSGPMDRAAKEFLLTVIRQRVVMADESRGLCDALARIAGRLAAVYEGDETDISLPELWAASRHHNVNDGKLNAPSAAKSADSSQLEQETSVDEDDAPDSK
jgi:CRISP-associated protein Cas1